MKRCGIFACDNGLGHVRRCYLVGAALSRRGWLVDLFCPQSKFKRISHIYGPHSNLRNKDFATNTSIQALREGKTMEWSYHAPDVRRYDVVVSDNHPEILYSRTDAVISGNFLWHDSIEGVAQSYKEQCEELLQARNPVVVATDLFASERVKAFPKYRPVGLYAPYKPSTVLDGPGFLLLSAGKSGACQEPFMDAVAALAAEGPGPFQGVLVDGELMPRESDVAAPWIQRATFDHEMYLSVTASICRPGVGTLTELLQTGGRPFCLHEEGNLEMDRNTEALTAGGLGDRFDDALTAVKEAKKFAADRRRREKHNNALARLDFKGIEQTCDILVT